MQRVTEGRATWKARAIRQSSASVFSRCLSTMSLAKMALPAGRDAVSTAGSRGPGERPRGLTLLVLERDPAGAQGLQRQVHVVHLLEAADGGEAELRREAPVPREQLRGPPTQTGVREKDARGKPH